MRANCLDWGNPVPGISTGLVPHFQEPTQFALWWSSATTPKCPRAVAGPPPGK